MLTHNQLLMENKMCNAKLLTEMMANSACSKNTGNHRWVLKMQSLTSQKLQIQKSQINKQTFECNDIAGRVHDRRLSRDGSAGGVGGVVHVNDDHLCRLAHLLTDTDVLIWLHGKGAEPNVGSIDANILELQQICSFYQQEINYQQTLAIWRVLHCYR